MGLRIPAVPQELSKTTWVRAADVQKLRERLDRFARSFAPFFYRKEQARLSRMYLEGLVSDLPRKSVELIALAHPQPRQALQRFAGQGKWDDTLVRGELHRQVARDPGDPNGILRAAVPPARPSCRSPSGPRGGPPRPGSAGGSAKAIFLRCRLLPAGGRPGRIPRIPSLLQSPRKSGAL